MTIERGVHLDLGNPQSGAGSMEGDTSRGAGTRREPDPGAVQDFQKALAGSSDPAEPVHAAPTGAVPIGLPFGDSVPQPLPAGEADAAPLSAQFDELLSRLFVGDGRQGARQVQMTIHDEVLPGVTITVQEDKGRVRGDFVCGVESSRLRLNRQLPPHANPLAQRLGREVLLRVLTDDEEDPCLLEIFGTP